ncbi:MAG TPA: AAA family ATPase, partial [Shinella sp.]|nr:AAA family ATPase [Shinella sp.]
ADGKDAPALPPVRTRLHAATIENYKSLEAISFALPDPPRDRVAGQDPETLPPTPCLLILGENSTGKSSILEAIALAAITEDMREELDLDGRNMTLNPEYMGDATKRAPRDCRIELTFRDGGKTSLTIDAKDGRMVPQGRLKGLPPPVFAYGAHRLFGKTRQKGFARRIETLFSNDRQISNPGPWLAGLQERKPEALDEVVSALRHIIRIDGDFRDIEVRPGKEDESGRCVINVRKKKPDGGEYIVPQRLDIVSSGYRAVLALVCDVLEGLMDAAPGAAPREARHGEAIVLIDEIEAHLHPRWKLQIVAGLRRALPGVTFVFTSHDPLCVRGMRDGEVMMLHRYQNTGDEGGSSMPEVVERVADFDNIETMTVEQLLTSDMFQLFSADDRRTDQAFAEVADLLARERASLDERERTILADFNAAIAEGLPYGRTEVTRLVQEAVAEYLALRRTAGSGRISQVREKAKAEIKKFLEGLLE